MGRNKPNVHELIPIALRSNFSGETSIKVEVELDSADIKLLKEYLKKTYSYEIKKLTEKLTVRDVYKFTNSSFKEREGLWTFDATDGKSGNTRILDLANKNKPVWRSAIDFLGNRMPPIWYFPNFLFEFPRRIYLYQQPNETNKDRFYRALLQDILHAHDSNASIETHLLQRAMSNSESDMQALDQLSLQMGRMVSKDVFSAWNQMFNRSMDKRVGLRIGGEGRNRMLNFR